MVDDNLVDTKNRDDSQATTEETPAGMEFRAKEGRTEFHFYRAPNAFDFVFGHSHFLSGKALLCYFLSKFLPASRQ